MNVTNLLDERTPLEKISDISSLDLMTFKSSELHAETLASLCTPTSKNCTTTLSGHASSETVALSALALIWLICTLHQ